MIIAVKQGRSPTPADKLVDIQSLIHAVMNTEVGHYFVHSNFSLYFLMVMCVCSFYRTKLPTFEVLQSILLLLQGFLQTSC